ncbi:unnamed protein product [Rotaria magnacalcarata]|uniref:Uncharacterized protein n=4 Tax=Rotaria magnacalcarata TaxID=392030 RepID=A0A815YA69_9BILA|nr:unnamed protein product [Rotaria magnacalcarata]CAF1568157.1 unnamed protein product [Rotaria magnacalcarata]
MGIANSRELHGNRQRRSSPCFESSNQGENRYRRYFFRRRMPSTTISPTLPNVAQSNSNQFLYGARSGMSSIPVYAPLPPLSSRLPPMSYNNFPVASYMPQQPMMVLPQRVAPMMSTPYMNPVSPSSPPMPTLYMPQAQAQAQAQQPFFNNMVRPAFMPMTVPGGALFSPPLNSVAPMRLLTDWTGGGQISPGFLGPPI